MHSLVLAVGATGVLDGIARGLRESFFMFWATLWALVLGFALSGVVQAFVSRGTMHRVLGDHRPGAIARAAGLGAASSSCSYAASAMAKTLFARGADFLAAMAFMFASTNLVIELGIVLVVLIGWQFAAGELIGGAIMIVLLVALGHLLLGRRLIEQARRRLQGARDEAGAPEDRHAHSADGDPPWQRRMRSLGGWSQAAGFALSDIRMLRNEMLIGYLVAGFLAALVPSGVWHDVFLRGHGPLTSVENVVVGPFLALISFVCSVGNVPLAAALWKGGISFGGVISFIFADLIALPLLLIYRKFYGGRLAARMLALFWVTMSAAGLVTDAIFSAAGLVPHHRPLRIVGAHLRLDYTTVLNVIFLLVFAGIVWLARNRRRLGGGGGYATDPVCGMQVQTANAPAWRRHGAQRLYFCSDRCAERFDADPARYAQAAPAPLAGRDSAGQGPCRDPVCGMDVDPASATSLEHAGRLVYFCSEHCRERFRSDAQRTAQPQGDPRQ
ncbi:MAG TPA: permease [Solirubrobacteraceae bacterium]|nr:permease [Solirubrobacteraceae bacterium]